LSGRKPTLNALGMNLILHTENLVTTAWTMAQPYTLGTSLSFPWGKVAEEWKWSLTSIYCEV
jgi:hypothetical protein